jgi:hypothetical protein
MAPQRHHTRRHGRLPTEAPDALHRPSGNHGILDTSSCIIHVRFEDMLLSARYIDLDTTETA